MQKKSSGDKTPPLLKPKFSPTHFQKVRQLFETISTRPAELSPPERPRPYNSHSVPNPRKGAKNDEYIFFDSPKSSKNKISVVGLFESEPASGKGPQAHRNTRDEASFRGGTFPGVSGAHDEQKYSFIVENLPSEGVFSKPEVQLDTIGLARISTESRVAIKHRTLPVAIKPTLYSSSSRPPSTFQMAAGDFEACSMVEPPRSTSAPSSARDSVSGESSFFNIKSEQDAVLALSLSLNGLYDPKEADSENNSNEDNSFNLGSSQTFATKDTNGDMKIFNSLFYDRPTSPKDKSYLKPPHSEDERCVSQPRPEKLGSHQYTASRRSCLNPKNLEPSLSTMLDTLDMEESSSQSSTRNSLEFSTYASVMSSASTAHSVESEESINGNNSTDSVVYKSPLESPPIDSKDQSDYIYSRSDNVKFSSPTSLYFTPTKCDASSLYESIRAASEFGIPPSKNVPFPPPKSSLRVKSSDKKLSSVNIIKTALKKPKIPTRKLSDPEIFAKAFPAATKLHTRTISNRSERIIDKLSPSQDALIPARLQSLDHLKSHSADALTTAQSNKHRHIIHELIDTEEVYLSDIRTIKKIYLDAAREREDLFSPRDLKLIFINIEEIIIFTEGFLKTLKSNTVEGSPPLIGKSFVEKHEELQEAYSQYFKMHEVSNSHLQELYTSHPIVSRFLTECDTELKKHSKAWDLHSLLIKPIQRVLKYPLLIKELLSVTNLANPDQENLLLASNLIQSTADHYNELKRRKDVIDRIIGPKPKKTELHIRAELNKKLFRGAIQLRKMAGIKTKTVDEDYNALAQQFHNQEALLRRFWDEVQRWTLAVEDSYNLQDRQARGFLALYAPPVHEKGEEHSYHLFSAEFSKLTLNLSQEMVSFLNHEVYTVLYEKINHLIRLFNTPALLMKKRDRKLQDYDILSSKENKGSLVESAQAYQLINQELVNELPRFLALSREMFSVLVTRFSWIQQEVYRRPAQQLARLLLAFEHPYHPGDNIVRIYNSRTLNEGVLDPFVKAAHAIINSGIPTDVTTARLARSISSEMVPKTELVSPTNTINGPLDGLRVKDSRVSPATVSYSRQTAPYPSIPSQLFAQEKEKVKDDDDSDDDSVSALDGSFLVPSDQATRRDHLLVDLEPSSLGFSLMNLFDDKPPEPPKEDSPEGTFNSLRTNRAQNLAFLTHNKSSSTPENTILKDLNGNGGINSGASDVNLVNTEPLARHASQTSATTPRGNLKLKGRFGSTESLTSNTTMSSYNPQAITPRASISTKSSQRSDGRQRNKPRPILFECKAAFPYSAASETELGLIPGMDLRVFKCSSATSCPWWYGEDAATGERGWFPSSFCKRS